MLFQTLPKVLFAIVCDYVDIDTLLIWSNRIKNGCKFSMIPYYLREDMSLPYIIENPKCLKFIRYQTPEICKVAMHYIENLLFVQKRFKTQEFCMAMVNKFGGIVLKYINKNNKGKKLCEAALKNVPLCFKFIPKNLRYIIKDVSISNFCMNRIFKYIPDELKTQDMCDITLNEYSKNLLYLPYEIKTQIINFRYIPNKFKSQTMCDIAFKKNQINLAHIPKEYITQNMCNIAANNPHIFKYIPIEFLTQNICKTVVSFYPWYIQYIPEDLKNQTMCDIAFNEYSYNIRYIPKRFITQTMCDKVENLNPYDIRYIPKKFITESLCDRAFNEYSSNFRHIPEKFINQTMCDIAFDECLDNIRYIPKRFITQSMYDEVLNSGCPVIFATLQKKLKPLPPN